MTVLADLITCFSDAAHQADAHLLPEFYNTPSAMVAKDFTALSLAFTDLVNHAMAESAKSPHSTAEASAYRSIIWNAMGVYNPMADQLVLLMHHHAQLLANEAVLNEPSLAAKDAVTNLLDGLAKAHGADVAILQDQLDRKIAWTAEAGQVRAKNSANRGLGYMQLPDSMPVENFDTELTSFGFSLKQFQALEDKYREGQSVEDCSYRPTAEQIAAKAHLPTELTELVDLTDAWTNPYKREALATIQRKIATNAVFDNPPPPKLTPLYQEQSGEQQLSETSEFRNLDDEAMKVFHEAAAERARSGKFDFADTHPTPTRPMPVRIVGESEVRLTETMLLGKNADFNGDALQGATVTGPEVETLTPEERWKKLQVLLTGAGLEPQRSLRIQPHPEFVKILREIYRRMMRGRYIHMHKGKPTRQGLPTVHKPID